MKTELFDDLTPTEYVLIETADELDRQQDLWGEQNHPDGTGSASDKVLMELVRAETDLKDSKGELTWADILREEFYEAVSEDDEEKLRVELVQVAAVALQWAVAIDRRRE